MPRNVILRRQRFFGGALGMIVLGVALTYHFFPQWFHVAPGQTPQRAMNLGGTLPTGNLPPQRVAAINELNAGPPLTLAPTAVIVARNRNNANLPEQKSAESPQVRELLARADKAFRAGQLAGDPESAAAVFMQALKEQPDNRRAVQGLFDVRARLVAEIDQDIAVGDVDAAEDLLDTLRTLPNAEQEVAQLEENLKTLATVRPMLAAAATLLQQGKADQPKGDNALELYRQVQQLDPQNAVAEQGIFQVQRAVLDRALAAVAQNDFAGAERELARAQAVRPGSQQMHDVQQRIDDMRRQRASGVLAQARLALDGGNLELATKLVAQARATDADLPELAQVDEQLTNARLYANYKPGQVFTDRYVDLAGKSPAMVVIPTGSFLMGAAAENEDRTDAQLPQHRVNLAKGFAIGRTEINVGEFREFVRASGYVPDSSRLGGASVYDERSGAMRDDSNAGWQDDYAGRKAEDNLPVVNVSWNDAVAYAKWLSERTGKHYRLPSEAEFEYALRGDTTSRYWWGDVAPDRKVENLTGSGDRSHSGRRWSNAFRGYRDGYWGPAPVMSFAANPFGLYDMDGNVSEWVADCWHDNYIRAPDDGSAWINPGCRAHVLRGGSWGSSPAQVISAYRQGAENEVRSGRVGFRVVREL
jgi:formylglycine-generating enzyme required for sulfatase activity